MSTNSLGREDHEQEHTRVSSHLAVGCKLSEKGPNHLLWTQVGPQGSKRVKTAPSWSKSLHWFSSTPNFRPCSTNAKCRLLTAHIPKSIHSQPAIDPGLVQIPVHLWFTALHSKRRRVSQCQHFHICSLGHDVSVARNISQAIGGLTIFVCGATRSRRNAEISTNTWHPPCMSNPHKNGK